MGTLTTHVLDLACGRPAAGMRIDLYSGRGALRRLVKSAVTNADGRCSEPLLRGAEFATGHWELVFHVGAYFTGREVPQSEPPFLDEVSVAFGIAGIDADAHYHVPLLISPWSYTTYRGS